MTPQGLHFVVPGPLDQRTGGYLYDARMAAGLRDLQWDVRVHELEGDFPNPEPTARAALTDSLAAMPDGSRVLIDGLAMGGLPGPIRDNGGRLRILALVHHPLAEETGLDPEERRRLQATEREALRSCSGVLVSSDFTARCLAAYGVSPARIRAVIPGTDPAPFATGPGPDQPPVLLCVASLTPRKGHDVLVRALRLVSDLDWTCICAGSRERDPHHARQVMREVAEAELQERIGFVGELRGPALSREYDRASAFVLASHYEGYGMALSEALAHGLPIVSTTGGAIPFTVPGEAGILVPPGDPLALAGALREILDPTSPLRDELAAGARRHAAGLASWPEAVRAFAVAIAQLTP